MDFGDLILYCVKLFEKHKDIADLYKKHFKYILVDEFQDTILFKINGLIYWLIHTKIFVVWVMTINQFIVGV